MAVVRSFDEYLRWLSSDAVIDELAGHTEFSRSETAQLLRMSVEEARFGYESVISRFPAGGRILEVGCGSAILTTYLREHGHDITGLEPEGYHLFPAIQAFLRRSRDVPLLRIPAEDLNPGQHGLFDFIFSVNVLEHIPALDQAMPAMASVLARGGRMWHTCPNYSVPYDPHFAVPLVPFRPTATAWLLPKHVRDGELWRGLNFVTAQRLMRLARASGLSVSFERGMMVKSIMRIETDPEFASRQAPWVRRAAQWFRRTGLLRMVKAFPPEWSTPMGVEMTRGT